MAHWELLRQKQTTKQTNNPDHIFDIHASVYRNIIPSFSQQDATFLKLFISKDALHVSGGFSAHHHEHITVHTASDIVNQYCC
jgi:hypothetical protein